MICFVYTYVQPMFQLNFQALGCDIPHLQPSSFLWHSMGQRALPDFQPTSASDGGANRLSIQPEASENYFNPSDLLNSDIQTFNASEYFDDAISNMCGFPLHSESELALMDFQSAKGNDGVVNNQRLQPGASESELNLTDFLNSVFENANSDEVTSKLRIASHDKENLSNMGFEVRYDGISSNTDNDATFGWQVKDISHYLSLTTCGDMDLNL